MGSAADSIHGFTETADLEYLSKPEGLSEAVHDVHAGQGRRAVVRLESPLSSVPMNGGRDSVACSLRLRLLVGLADLSWVA